MAEIELLPCPFCGREAVMHAGWTKDGDGRAMVTCTRITLSDGCASIAVERATKATAEKDAAAMWNQRVKSQRDKELETFARALLLACNWAWQGVPPTHQEYIGMYQQAKGLGLLDA